MRFRVSLIPNENGGYTIYAPVLKGCISEGNSKEEALKNIKEAIELYLEEVEDKSLLEESLTEEIII